MDTPIQAILFLGIIPALILLYISLKGFEGVYKDKSLFLVFVIGIIMGVASASFRIIIPFIPLLITTIAVFAFLDQLMKTILLNLPRLQRKKETVLYGLALGLGFGSSYTPYMIIIGSSQIPDSTLSLIALVIFGSIGYILVHGSTAALLGYGIFKDQLMKYLLLTLFIHIVFNAFADLADPRLYENPNITEYFPVLQLILVVFGLILFWYIQKNILPEIRTYEEKRKRSKK